MSAAATKAVEHRGMTAEPDPADHRQIEAYLTRLAATYAKTTVTAYRSALNVASRELPAGLAGAYPDELLAWLGGKNAAGTKYVYGVILRGFYRWAVQTRRLGTDPSAELPRIRRPQRRPRPVSHDQLATILRYARPDVRRWSAIAAYAGARAGEIAALDRSDVTPDGVLLRGKGDKERLVPAHPAVLAAVDGLPPGLVAGGKSPHNVSRTAAREYRRLGLTVTLHQLRHWYGTWAQVATGNSRITQELLGHASLNTTQVYTAVSSTALRSAVAGLPAFTPAASVAGAGPEAGAAHPLR